jgi:hypothetical protein
MDIELKTVDVEINGIQTTLSQQQLSNILMDALQDEGLYPNSMKVTAREQ